MGFNMENKENLKKEQKDIKIITGTGEDLDISPVYDHIKMDKPKKDTNKKIIVPKKSKI